MPRTIHLAVALAKLGYHAVPHLSARLIHDRVELGQILVALKDAGIKNVFVVAGDAREPAGLFPGALPLLAALPPGHGLTENRVTAPPRRHPVNHPGIENQAMRDTRRLD